MLKGPKPIPTAVRTSERSLSPQATKEWRRIATELQSLGLQLSRIETLLEQILACARA